MSHCVRTTEQNPGLFVSVVPWVRSTCQHLLCITYSIYLLLLLYKLIFPVLARSSQTVQPDST